jgi:hypothetical protein
MRSFCALFVCSIGLAAPALKPENKLADTVWCGHTADGWFMTLEFKADGTLIMAYRGTVIDKASWVQTGNKIYYQVNNRFSEFTGKLNDGIITGESNNIWGKTWATKLKPLKK